MSKNFEEAYKALAAEEVPDLWSRIEAGLTPRSAEILTEQETSTEKAAENKISVTNKMTDVVNENLSKKSGKLYTDRLYNDENCNNETDSKNVSSKKNTGKIVTFIKRYKPALAAAVCVIVIIPAAVVIGQLGMGGSKMTEYSTDMAAAEMPAEGIAMEEAYAEAALEEAAIEDAVMEETAIEESVAEDIPIETTGTAGKMQEKASGSGNATSAVTSSSGAAAEAAELESSRENPQWEQKAADATAECKEEAAQEEVYDIEEGTADQSTGESALEKKTALIEKLDAEDGTVLDHVKVRVYSKEEYETMGNLYLAEVISDTKGLLKEGAQIMIYIPAYSSFYWTDQEAEYDVSLEYDSQREYPFYLKMCY